MDVIATRTFTCADGASTYEVLIARPVEVGRDEWRCDIEIRGPAGAKRTGVFGVDALQALMLSFEIIRAQLGTIEPPLQWLHQPIDLTFPRAIPTMFGEDFYRRIERHIDGAIDEFNAQHEKR